MACVMGRPRDRARAALCFSWRDEGTVGTALQAPWADVPGMVPFRMEDDACVSVDFIDRMARALPSG